LKDILISKDKEIDRLKEELRLMRMLKNEYMSKYSKIVSDKIEKKYAK